MSRQDVRLGFPRVFDASFRRHIGALVCHLRSTVAVPSMVLIRRTRDPTHAAYRPPLVVALGGPSAVFQPRLTFPEPAVFLRARSVDGLLAIAENVSGGVVLLRAESFISPADLHRWRSCHPADWLTALCLSLNMRAVSAALSWLAEWPLPVLLDQPVGTSMLNDVSELAEHAPAIRESCRLLPWIVPRLVAVKPIVAAKLVAIYASPHPPNSLKQLAAECQLSERHLRRLLLALGVPSSYLFLATSRVLRAYADVARGELSLSEMAHRFGFGTVRTLRSQWSDVTGGSLERARRVPLSDVAVRSMAERALELLD